ncbi:MAG: hypothetical protein K8R08_04670 [Methanosarcinales archaeon]|nr:hypothetical protein [Methanosarcinales archaeon]
MFDINDLNIVDKKKKFIEVLLIVGGLIGSLGLSGAKAVSEDAINVYFVTASYLTFFVLFSIFLYVLLMRPLKLPSFVEIFLIIVVSFIVGIYFSLIVVYPIYLAEAIDKSTFFLIIPLTFLVFLALTCSEKR